MKKPFIECKFITDLRNSDATITSAASISLPPEQQIVPTEENEESDSDDEEVDVGLDEEPERSENEEEEATIVEVVQ